MILPIIGAMPSELRILKSIGLYDTIFSGWILRANFLGVYFLVFHANFKAIPHSYAEAARIDGASKIQQVWHITLPGLLPTIVLMLILKVGYILDTGFEQVLIFYNPAVYDVADIIQTYVYRIGLGQANFSLATALGLFNSVVAFILVVSANTVSKKLLGRSIW